MPGSPPDQVADETVERRGDAARSGAPAIGLGARMGRYDLLSVLGTGGMGVVFEARDPELDRAIAVEVLRSPPGAIDGAAAARLRRESVTMARLVHPNAIRVYDVGVANGHVFVAMELVRGCTLAEWAARAPRSVAEVVGAFRQAGRGLAAAHDAGLVHRDFKPQNVLVGDDGRVLVTDFGLARAADAAVSEQADGAPQPHPYPSASDVVTHPGDVVGTPAYMAPEQRAGAAIDARADQYSFCLALCRILRDRRSAVVTATTATTANAGDTAAAARRRERMRDLPRRLRRPLRRGLDPDPDRRFPSMHELLARLEPKRSGLRWGLAAAAAVAVAAVALYFAGRSQREPCPVPAERLARVWGPARSAALREWLTAVDPERGPARFAAASSTLDQFARGWSAMHVEACRDTRVRGRQSDQLLDRRMVCLDGALVALDQTVAAVEAASDRFALDRAMLAVTGLPSLSPCGDLAALTETVPPPTDPSERAAFDALTRELAVLDVSSRASQTPDDLGRARAVVARARDLGHPTILAAALWVQARLLAPTSDEAATVAALRAHIAAAAAAHDDRMVAWSWIKQIAILGGGHPDDAEALIGTAEIALARVDDDPLLRLGLIDARLQIAMARLDVVGAQAQLDEAHALLAQARAAGIDARRMEITIGMDAAYVHSIAGRWPEAAVASRAVVSLTAALLGPDHPEAITAHFNAGVASLRSGDPAGALPDVEAAARIGEARLPPSPRITELLDALGATLLLLDRHDDAIPHLRRALAIARATMADDDPRLGAVATNLGSALLAVGDLAEARPLVEEAAGFADRAGYPPGKSAVALFNLGNLEQQTGHCDRAVLPARRALALYEAEQGQDSAEVSSALDLLADCLGATGHPRDAIAAAERVLGATSSTPIQLATAHVMHARSLAHLGRVSEAIREMETAREQIITLGFPADVQADVDAWLAAHRRRRR